MFLSFLLICALGFDPSALKGAYALKEARGSSQLHITQVKGLKAKGWLVQEFFETGSTTRWYARVSLDLDQSGNFKMVIRYQRGEKKTKTGASEVWPMDQRRDEEGRLLEDGGLKILPDRWQRSGPPKSAPKGLSTV